MQNVFTGDVAARYDEDCASIATPEALGPMLDVLEELAGGGAALEFAIGTGRVGLPLAARGVPVSGIELSEDMVAELRRKPRGRDLPVVIGDMATTTVDGTYSLVYLVFNTLSNLLEQDEQVGCFANAAHHLAPGGAFMVEQGEPDLRRFPPGAVAVPFEIGDDHLGFDTYDLVKQQLTSHHYRAGQRPHRLGVDLRQDGLTGRAPQDSYVSERGWSRRCSCTIHRSEQLGAETSAASPVGSVFSHAATAWAFSSRPMSH